MDLSLKVTHVSGERIKTQGSNDISRDQFNEDICSGDYMLLLCPWNDSAFGLLQKLKNG